jgi:hypothetical protein
MPGFHGSQEVGVSAVGPERSLPVQDLRRVHRTFRRQVPGDDVDFLKRFGSFFKDLESHAARDRLAGRPAYDFGWMWADLGLDRPG